MMEDCAVGEIGIEYTFLGTRASQAFLAADCSASFFEEHRSSPTYQ
jgi:hypothetical protein